MAIENFSIIQLGSYERITIVLVIVAIAHISVLVIRHQTQRFLSAEAMIRWTKVRTVAGLTASILVFSLYFGAIGLVLSEFGISLTAYLASASILGLAIGFGSQGVVQDVVTGLTVIFSNLFQVGDLVEVTGQTGLVQSITMRFTILLSPLGAEIYIPNRTIANVVVYPRGYVRCFADITLSTDEQTSQQMLSKVNEVTKGFVQQYRGIFRSNPEMGQPNTLPSGRNIVRVKFRIWPGRNAAIETAYKQEMVATLKTLNTEYADWMVSINNEVSESPAAHRTKPYKKN